MLCGSCRSMPKESTGRGLAMMSECVLQEQCEVPRHNRLRKDRNSKGTWEYYKEDETPRNEVNEWSKCMCNMSNCDG